MTEGTESSVGSGPNREPLPEGEESAPAGTRAAAIVRWSIVALMAVAAAGAWTYHVTTGGLIDVARHRFRCPMHPTVVTEQKGECPICGMDLVPVSRSEEAEEADEARVRGTSKGTGEARATERAAMAPGAATDATATPPAATPIPLAHGTVPRVTYTCPMHPAFVTDDPKARCPDCGMKLVPKDADAAPERAAVPPESAPGLAPLELSAERIQLIGIKTAVALREPLGSTIRTVGFVTASEKGLVSVNARFSGWIESLGAGDIGQLVEKGDVLATVYSPDAVGRSSSSSPARAGRT